MIIEAEASEGADLPVPRGRFLIGPRFTPGPLRTARRRAAPSGAAKGAAMGGLIGLAVLAALSLPLVLAQVDGRPVQSQAEALPRTPARSVALVPPAPVAQPVAAQSASVERAPAQAVPVPPAPTPAKAQSRSALSLDSLPTLTQEASDIDLDPGAAPEAAVPRQPPRVATQRRAAPSKPAQP